jgi:hypothetical protein
VHQLSENCQYRPSVISLCIACLKVMLYMFICCTCQSRFHRLSLYLLSRSLLVIMYSVIPWPNPLPGAESPAKLPDLATSTTSNPQVQIIPSQVHQNRDNELPTEIKVPEEFDWVKEVGAHRCGATISSDLAARTERRQQAILTRELRSEWERLGRINCKYFS